MASTVKVINELFNETIDNLSLDTNNWLSFLECASMNYKYDFMEQLLIYAQKPSAVACADYDTWNDKLNRYVKGAGIALLTEYNGLPRLRYVWDISNTFSKYGRYARPIKIWKVNKVYEEQMIESLNNKYGELENTETFKDTLLSVATVLTDDNYTDYFDEFINNVDNTKLASIEELFVEKSYRDIMENSIAFMLLKRCGLNPYNYFTKEDFKDLNDFMELENITRFGSAISDIAEMGIREIHTTLKNIQINELEENRTFDKKDNINYYESEKEGSNENENDLSKSRGLLHTESESRTKESIRSREVFNDEITILEGTQESRLSNPNDEEHISRTLGENREISSTEIININERNEERTQFDRRIEDDRPNEMGGTNEQYQTFSGGSNLERTDLQLEYYDKDSNYCSYFVVDYKINQILSKTPFLKVSSNRIIDFFENEKRVDKRAEFLKSIFNTDFAQIPINNISYRYKAYSNGVLFWLDELDVRKEQSFISWEDLTYHFDSMILLKQIERLPNEQISLLDFEPIEQREKKPNFEFTNEFLERYLQSESYTVRTSISELYEKGLSSKDIIKLLKDMYGIGGASSTVKGAGVGYSSSGKGIVFTCGRNKDLKEKLFTWKIIENTISKLINEHRYLIVEEEIKEVLKDSIVVENIEEIDKEDIQINDEVGLINYVFSVHKIYDINVNINSNDEIVAYDEENTWVGKELYDFLFNELFVYNENGKIDLLDDECVEQLREYRKKYDPEIIVQKDLIEFYVGLHKQYEDNLGTPDFYVDNQNKNITSVFINDDFKLSYQKYLVYLLVNLEEVDKVPDEYLTKIQKELTRVREKQKELIGKEFSIDNETFTIIDILEDDLDYQVGDMVAFKNNETGKTDTDILDYIESFFDTVEREEHYSLTEKNNVELLDINDNNQEIIDDPEKEDITEIKKKEKIRNFVLHPEIPYESRINYKIKDDYLGIGTAKERFRNNINAIKVLKKCEMEDRYATPEEQEILSKYVGWGGLSEAFDVSKLQWNNEYNELKSLLTEKEYEKAKESVLTAFYTPPVVIKAMYQVLSNMGLEKGNILEPSCGIGNFIGMLPNNEKLKIYGVEIDDISGRIARQLYQKSSIAIQGFEETDYSNSFFDVAIGNVPFGNYPLYDKKYDKHKFLVHDYFFAKTIDKVRPGGIIAFITSQGTLDKENDSVRKYIAQRADLLGAIRLPNNTFKDSAGTTITSDIIFLQKRDSITDIMPSWVKLGKTNDGIPINQYFVEHPDKVLGDFKVVSGQFGDKTTCLPFDDKSLPELLENAIQDITAEIKNYELTETEEEIDESIEADPNVANFSYALVDNQIYYRENSRMYPQSFALTTENRVKSLMELRDCTRQLINLQLEDYEDEVIERQQEKLNYLYDTFTKKYGIINSRANASAFDADSSYYLLCSLEVLDKKGEFKRKADMFFKRTIKPNIEITHADTSMDALVLSMSNKAVVDFDYMQELTGFTKDKIIKDLEGEIFHIPYEDKWVTADEYLSGNVRKKIKSC